jgi:uncharacterized membrane protein YqgA involved in biofilm formation
MIGFGTIINTVAIIIGAISGSLLRNGLSDRFREIIMQALGLSILMIGISGSLQGIFKVVDGDKLNREFLMLMIFSLVIGAIIGELLNIEDKLERMGLWIQNKYLKNSGNFAEGFITASLVFCIGAMAIIGSLEDGLTGSTDTLFAKSILDGVISVIFAASFGIGVAFSSILVFIYQGSITLMAGVIKPYLTDTIITQTSLVGSVLIIAIGFNILEYKRIKVGNMLPSIFIALVFYLITEIF